jgi:ribokinase
MILVVGNINYDILLPLSRLPGPHEKIISDGAITGFGGSAANTAYWLAKLGTPVTLSGAVGNDAMGVSHIVSLREAGVDTRGVSQVETASGLAIIFSQGREKRMIRAPGANLKGRVRDELVAGLEPGQGKERDLLYLSGGDIPTLKNYAALALGRKVPVICGFHSALDPEMTGIASGFILNSDEVRMITGLEDPEEGILALDSDIAAVTLSEGGCLVSDGINIMRVPAAELDPVDRTGGGDAFAAGFLSGLARGLDIQECGRRGNELALKVIMGMGARPEITIEN